MARPIKHGLDYFPMDVDFFDDDKISAIAGEFGIKGEIIIVKLLCTIYRNGHFALWNDLTKMNLLKKLPGVTIELLEQVVNRLVKWGFFNEPLFNSDKVLTSSGIQKRYIEATKRRKDAPELSYCIHNVCNNTQAEGVSAYINPQSKVKESKVDVLAPTLEIDNRETAAFEMLKRVTAGFSDLELILEAKRFCLKYPNAIIMQSAGLINAWASHMKKETEPVTPVRNKIVV